MVKEIERNYSQATLNGTTDNIALIPSSIAAYNAYANHPPKIRTNIESFLINVTKFQ